MINDDGFGSGFIQLGLPHRQAIGDISGKGVGACRIGCFILWIKLAHFESHFPGNKHGISRIQGVMRISQGMNVAHGAINISARNIKQVFNRSGTIHVSLGSGLDAWVPGLIQQEWQPANFQFQAIVTKQVCLG